MWIEEHKLYISSVQGTLSANDLLLNEERNAHKESINIIAGVDEAGRGPLAGPLVVSSVILPKYIEIEGLDDSKKLSAKKREELMPIIMDKALCYAIIIIDVETIDSLNILRATHHGMRQSIKQLKIRPDIALIDGLPLPDPPVPQYNLIKGDSRSANIAAASILAKVTRDNIMDELDEKYPEYGFSKHKGYPTKEHLFNLQKCGVSDCHRKSYAPVKEALLQQTLDL